jgi:hypothetical protein
MLESAFSRRIASLICVAFTSLAVFIVYLNVEEACAGPPEECGKCMCEEVPLETCEGLERQPCWDLDAPVSAPYCEWVQTNSDWDIAEGACRTLEARHPTFSMTMLHPPRHRRALLFLQPCFLGLLLWDVLVLRTPRMTPKRDTCAYRVAAVLVVLSLPFAVLSLWLDPAGWPHVVMLQVWVHLRFFHFLPLLYLYISTIKTNLHRVVSCYLVIVATLIFALAFYLTAKVWTAVQPGAVQVYTIYLFFSLGIFTSAAAFVETFEEDFGTTETDTAAKGASVPTAKGEPSTDAKGRDLAFPTLSLSLKSLTSAKSQRNIGKYSQYFDLVIEDDGSSVDSREPV